MTEIFYPHSHTELRKILRNNATPAERALWKRLQNRRLLGFKFRRQAGIGRYIADFYCPSARLIIEIDGDIHSQPTTKEYDLIRTHFLEDLGLSVIRFTNQEVLSHIGSVLVQILHFLPSRTPLRPTPPSCFLHPHNEEGVSYLPSEPPPHREEGAGGGVGMGRQGEESVCARDRGSGMTPPSCFLPPHDEEGGLKYHPSPIDKSPFSCYACSHQEY